MQVKELSLEGLKLIIPTIHQDNRGYFIESYQKQHYQAHGISADFCQDNHSFSKRGTIRGMHFQGVAPSGEEQGQAKLIYVVQGKIFDVVVDIRPESKTFGKWEAVILESEQLHAQLFVPAGFAHGFCVLSDQAHVVYKVDQYYCSEKEGGFRWNDPDLAISWPIEPGQVSISRRDRESPYFSELFAGRYLKEQEE